MGKNIDLVSKMFPQCYWYLIDPNPHYDRLYRNSYIKEIRTQYFTNNTAKEYKKKLKGKYVLFVSDIRKTDVKGNITENNIKFDNEMQMDWVKIINPKYSQLKFRIPRFENDYKYLEGIIYLQSYASKATTETRLVVKENAKMTIYDLDKYEGKLYYHNRISRASIYPHNIENVNGLDNCYDCNLFVMLIKKYKRKYNKIERRSVKQIIMYIMSQLKDYNKLHIDIKKLLKSLQQI